MGLQIFKFYLVCAETGREGGAWSPLGDEEEACSTVGLFFFMNEERRREKQRRTGGGARFLLRTRGRKFMNGSRLRRAAPSVNNIVGQRSSSLCRALSRGSARTRAHAHTHSNDALSSTTRTVNSSDTSARLFPSGGERTKESVGQQTPRTFGPERDLQGVLQGSFGGPSGVLRVTGGPARTPDPVRPSQRTTQAHKDEFGAAAK